MVWGYRVLADGKVTDPVAVVPGFAPKLVRRDTPKQGHLDLVVSGGRSGVLVVVEPMPDRPKPEPGPKPGPQPF